MNIDVVGRMRAAETGDSSANLKIDKSNVVKCGRLSFTFTHLHRTEAGACEIFSRSIEPLLDLCITGFNTSLLIVGEADAGKQQLLMGDKAVRNGLLPILFASLFAKIGDDDTYASLHNPADGRRLDRVQMQMVEIRGEEMIDLLNPSTKASLQLTETADAGVRIENLTTMKIPSVDAGSDALQAGCLRSRGLHDSAIITYIRLTLVPHEKSEPNHSWFSVVMLPASEGLPVDIDSVDIKDVPSSQKFIFCLLQYVQEVSMRSTPDAVIKRPDSVLASLLRDELGGNCKTRVFTFLKPCHESAKIDALFRFLTDLSRIKNYPILNDAFALQLINRYRAEIMALERNGELSAEILQLRVENVDLRDAYEGLLPKLDQCRRRVEQLDKENIGLTDQILEQEEDKLKLSKKLVEMQIDNNKLKEEYEATKFELSNRIMQLENEIMEANMKTENCLRNIEALNARNADLETELKDITQEFTVLKTNYSSLMKAYEDEVAHADEISAELLNLANTKAELIRNIAVLSKKADAGNPEIDIKHARNVVAKRPSTRIKTSEMSHSYTENNEYDLCRTTEKRHKVEMERLKQAFMDNERILETKIENLTKELTEARDATRAKYTALAGLNARVLTLTDQKNSLESQNNRLQHKLKSISEDFRARLVKFVEDAALFIDRQKTYDPDGSRRKMEPYVNEMLGELKQAYHVREEQLSSVAQDCRAQMKAIVRRHEALVAAYRELKIRVSDLGIEDINLGPDEKDLVLSDTELHSTQQREITRLREDLNQSELEREQLKMRHVSDAKSGNAQSDNNMNNSVEATSPQSWAVLQKQLKEFTLNTQQELESERAGLLSRNAMLEQEVTELNEYINSDLKRYKNEIARLQGLLTVPRGKKLH